MADLMGLAKEAEEGSSSMDMEFCLESGVALRLAACERLRGRRSQEESWREACKEMALSFLHGCSESGLVFYALRFLE